MKLLTAAPTVPNIADRVIKNSNATAANKTKTHPIVSRVRMRSLSFLLFSLPLPKLFKFCLPSSNERRPDFIFQITVLL